MKAIVNLLRKRTPSIGGDSSPDGAIGEASPPGKWGSIAVSENEIADGSYKKHLGGGATQWELRGRFQLFFLKQWGLVPGSRLLDVGCGPIRAGIHFIRYLDKGNYFGFDFNKDFIKAARRVSEEQGLTEKSPRFEVVDDFNIQHWVPSFDYAIAFSVLNHCRENQRQQFFGMIGKTLRQGGRLYISHAFWFSEAYLAGNELKLTKQFHDRDVNIREWGWPEPEKECVFPIIELTRI